eukprot:TRINITY_DN2458_c0_g1_i4.p1 TRINITY_DN2458_c0_g1~~TRINITY_DN2458_c0_g1_i4.p1  ORF type:complete len:1408 (+),score=143.65 TRINITY_DN2458_c0_g1_i4:75-4298(+)
MTDEVEFVDDSVVDPDWGLELPELPADSPGIEPTKQQNEIVGSQNAHPGTALDQVESTLLASGRKENQEIAKLLRHHDTNGDGTYSKYEVESMCQHLEDQLHMHMDHEASLKRETNLLKKLVVGTGIVAIVTVIINAVIVVSTGELMKDTAMSGSQMHSKAGGVVQTASSDVSVVGGRLLVRPQSGESRHLSTCPENVTCTGTDKDPMLQTQPAPLQKTRLSSTAPDAFLGELKTMRLNNPKGETINIPVEGYQRKMSPSNSKCGSILMLSTPHGVISLDDYDIILSDDVKTFLRASSFDFQETLSAKGRRLSAGHDVAGLFQFFMDYEWNCTSYGEPLQHLKPPYEFVLETRVLCPDDCKSSVFTNYNLPGMVRERTVEYIGIKETVYAFGDIVISHQEYPSHPGIVLMTYTNVAQNISRKQIETFGTAHSCSESGIPAEENFMTRYENYKIVVVGDITQNRTTYRRYQIVSTVTTDDAERDRTTVEFWEESLSEQPYKYFMPNVASASISYFKSFNKDLSMDMADVLSQSFNVSCESPFGPNIKKDGFIEENEDTLKWYKRQYEAGPAGIDDIPERDRAYFERVKDMYVEPRRAFETGRRMQTSSKDLEQNPLAASTYTTTRYTWDRDLIQRSLKSSGGGGKSSGGGKNKGDVVAERRAATVTSCPIQFELGGEGGFGLEICTVVSSAGKKFTGEVSTPKMTVGVFTFAATGEIAYVVDNYEDPSNSPCCFAGKIELSVGMGVDLILFSFSATLKGSLMFGSNDAGNAKMIAALGLEIAVKLFGLDMGASVSGSVKLEIDNFGLDSATILWKYGVTIEVSFFSFKIHIPWKGDIVPKQRFSSGAYGGGFDPDTVAGDWTKDCACGDFFKCGELQFCDNWPIKSGGGRRCNQGDYKFIHFAWESEAECPSGYKRCFCKLTKEKPPHPGFEWSPCYASDNWPCIGDWKKCVRNYCLSKKLSLPESFEWEDCGASKYGDSKFSGKCLLNLSPPRPVPPAGPPGPYGDPGERGPTGPKGPRGAPCTNVVAELKDVQKWAVIQQGQVKEALDQVAWMTTSFENNVIGSIADAQKEPVEAMQYAKDIDQRITELSQNYITLANDVSSTFANKISELRNGFLFSQPIASLRHSKATSVPCGPCTWPERTFQIISGSGPAFESKGPRQKVGMGTSNSSIAAQQWTFTSKSVKSSDGSCVDFRNEYEPGGGVGLWDCHGGSNQLIVYSSLTKQLKTVWGNQCLDFNAEHQSLGSWFCYAGLNQEWTLSDLDQGNTPTNCPESCTWPEQQLHVISHRDGLAMQAVLGKDIDLGVPNAAFGEQLFTWNPDSLQLQTGQGQGKKCVAMTGQSDGAKLRLADCNPSVDDAAFQVFTYIEADKMIKHFYLNLCLDNGGQGALHLWTCSSTNVNQKFELV